MNTVHVAPRTAVMPRALWLLRHAESEGNVADARALDAGAERLDLIARDADMPLSDVGRTQAEALGRSWKGLRAGDCPTVILCSPYERAAGTAEIAVAAAGWHIDLVRDERLRERELGLLDGYTRHGIEQRFPEEAERRAWVGKFYYRPPGGESWADVAGRLRAVIDAAERRYAGERLLLVTHQAVIMVARYVLENLTEREVLDLDRTESIANTALVRYDYERGVPRLVAFNDVAHLDAHDAPVTEERDATALSR